MQSKTWLPVPESSKTRNVAVDDKNPNSILNFYKQLINLRRQSPALRNGSYIALNREDQHVLSMVSEEIPSTRDVVLVALNMSSQPRKVAVDLNQHGIVESNL